MVNVALLNPNFVKDVQPIENQMVDPVDPRRMEKEKGDMIMKRLGASILFGSGDQGGLGSGILRGRI